MDSVPTASVLRSLDNNSLTEECIKASQSPTVDQEMCDTASLQQTSDASTKSSSGRASFSSVREVDNDIAQAFSSTKISSYFREGSDTAVDDISSGPPSAGFNMAETQFMPPVTQPHSRLHGYWFPAVAADNFQGWKQIGVRGKQASRSFGDLQALRMVWSTAPAPKKVKGPVEVQRTPGDSPLERLPMEIKSKLNLVLLERYFKCPIAMLESEPAAAPRSTALVDLKRAIYPMTVPALFISPTYYIVWITCYFPA